MQRDLDEGAAKGLSEGVKPGGKPQRDRQASAERLEDEADGQYLLSPIRARVQDRLPPRRRVSNACAPRCALPGCWRPADRPAEGVRAGDPVRERPGGARPGPGPARADALPLHLAERRDGPGADLCLAPAATGGGPGPAPSGTGPGRRGRGDTVAFRANRPVSRAGGRR